MTLTLAEGLSASTILEAFEGESASCSCVAVVEWILSWAHSCVDGNAVHVCAT